MANYVNYKIAGIAKKTIIPAGKTVTIPALTSKVQITNFGDFQRGFFEIVAGKIEEKEVIETKEPKVSLKNVSKKTSKKKLKEDSLGKVKKEVKDYTEKDKK